MSDETCMTAYAHDCRTGCPYLKNPREQNWLRLSEQLRAGDKWFAAGFLGWRFWVATQGGRSPTGVAPQKAAKFMLPPSAADDRSRPHLEFCGQGSNGPSAIVKIQIPANRSARLADTGVGLEIDLFVLTDFQIRSTKTLSRQEPLPSMLIAMALFSSTPVKPTDVNWLP